MSSFHEEYSDDEEDSVLVARKNTKKTAILSTSSEEEDSEILNLSLDESKGHQTNISKHSSVDDFTSEEEDSEVINSSLDHSRPHQAEVSKKSTIDDLSSEEEDSEVINSYLDHSKPHQAEVSKNSIIDDWSFEEEDSEVINSSLDDSNGHAANRKSNKLSPPRPNPKATSSNSSFQRTLEGSVFIESEDEDANVVGDSRNLSPNISQTTSTYPKTTSIEVEEIVELISSDEEPTCSKSVLKQSDLRSFVVKPEKCSPLKPPENVPSLAPRTTKQDSENNKVAVTEQQFNKQKETVRTAEYQLTQARNALRVVRLESLPDKGKLLLEKAEILEKKLKEQQALLSNMVVTERNQIAWDEIEAGVGAVAPRTLGKKGIARFNAEKEMTMERLDQLHKSLENCPSENDLAEPPDGLKIELMHHQKRALAWLLWREHQKPSGGILADDMGLGKTLTMISLTLKVNQIEKDEEKENVRDKKYLGGTLVVCPASLINQWSGEVERRTKRGLLSIEYYHGPKRETKAKRLAQHDLVITTYTIVLNEYQKNGAVFQVKWRRIILDEAHQIRNHKSQSSEAVCKLSAKSRWALTGTPVHNKELDMYALLKFLRCTPFDDLNVWRHWVSDKSTGGQERLHAVISSLMLRRTKVELVEKGFLKGLPERKWELITVKLDKEEVDVYQKILIFSRTLFAQFLHQRAEKNQDAYDMKFGNNDPMMCNNEYFKMRDKLLKINKVREIKQHEILVLLLRLRQICCHPSLITKMLEGNEDLGDAESQEESEELNLLEQLNNLTVNDDHDGGVAGISEGAASLKEASQGYLNPSQPVFAETRKSSKIRSLIKILKETIATGDKAIVVSQWTSLLRLVALQIKNEGISFDTLDGSIPVQKRMPIVDNFNNPSHKTRVLLLSLTAGGVGLNLVGANHLFLMDLHWNPQLENQAQDRIYRMGQTKNISVYKFMASDTIEERIKQLQDNKLELANSMLTGSKQVINSKLSLQDLKMLFEFK